MIKENFHYDQITSKNLMIDYYKICFLDLLI